MKQDDFEVMRENMHGIHHMGGKRTKALFDALLVSDIGKHFFKYAQLRLVKSRDMKPCLPH